MINLTTGPVAILPSVTAALTRPPIAHRSAAFALLHQTVTYKLSSALGVKDTYILTGSGTLANEVMITQIGLLNQYGLILSNGEFGDRLTGQAQRQNLNFDLMRIATGSRFNINDITVRLSAGKIKWVLFCHCETSTGVVNPLDEITTLAKEYSCAAFVDCMSTLGGMKLNLAEVAMATASSGKAIGAYAGLALVFSNMQPAKGTSTPLYLDLQHAYKTNGIPFTLSYNLLAALNEAIDRNMDEQRWKALSAFSRSLSDLLNEYDLAPFSTPDSRVFTIVPKNGSAHDMANELLSHGIQLCWESDYLIKNNWLQLAVMATYRDHEIVKVLAIFKETLFRYAAPAPSAILT